MDEKLGHGYLATVRFSYARENVAAFRHVVAAHGRNAQVLPNFSASDVEADDHPRLTIEAYEFLDALGSHLLVELGGALLVGVGDVGVTPDEVRVHEAHSHRTGPSGVPIALASCGRHGTSPARRDVYPPNVGGDRYGHSAVLNAAAFSRPEKGHPDPRGNEQTLRRCDRL